MNFCYIFRSKDFLNCPGTSASTAQDVGEKTQIKTAKLRKLHQKAEEAAKAAALEKLRLETLAHVQKSSDNTNGK